MNPFAKTLRSLLISALLVAPVRAFAANPDKEKQDKESRPPEFSSFLHYQPRAKDFQNVLAPVAGPIEKAGELQAANKKEEANELYRRSIAAGEALAAKINRAFTDELYFLLGFAHEALGEDGPALKAYEKSLALRAGNTLALFHRAHILQRQSKCEAALPIYREVLWEAPRLGGEIHYLMGECLEAIGKIEEAAKEFDLSQKKNPDFLPGLRQLVKTQSELLAAASDPKRRAELQTSLTQALNNILKQSPGDRDASAQLVGLLLSTSDPLYGAQKIVRAQGIAEDFAKSSGFKDETFVRYLFQAQIKRGDIDEAEKVLEAAKKALPKSAVYAECARQLEIEKQLKAQAPAEATTE